MTTLSDKALPIAESHRATTDADTLDTLLRDLCEQAAGIEGAVLINRDGLTMVSHGRVSDEEHLGASCGALFSQASKSAGDLQRGVLDHVLLRAEHGWVVIVRAGPEVVLAILAQPLANLGMVLLEAARVAEAVPRML